MGLLAVSGRSRTTSQRPSSSFRERPFSYPHQHSKQFGLLDNTTGNILQKGRVRTKRSIINKEPVLVKHGFIMVLSQHQTQGTSAQDRRISFPAVTVVKLKVRKKLGRTTNL